MPIKTKCKICNCYHAKLLDEWLESGKWSYRQMVVKAAKLDPPELLTPKNFWNHNLKHRIPLVSEIEDKKSGGNKDPKKPQSKKRYVTNLKFCDAIIADVYDQIEQGVAHPTITEGLKAVELKHKIKEGNPYEEALLGFITQISHKNPIVDPEDDTPEPPQLSIHTEG